MGRNRVIGENFEFNNGENLGFNNLFSIPFKSVDLNHLDIKAIKEYCLLKADGNINRSNEGGWHSDFFDLTSLDEVLKPLCENILDISKEFCDELGVKQVTHIQNMWCIVNKNGHYNREHIHPNSFFSGAFYPSDEYAEDCGKVVFLHPAFKEMQYDWDGTQEKFNEYNSLSMNIKPVRGLLMIFPSYLAHSVHINRSDKDRLVISFNLK